MLKLHDWIINYLRWLLNSPQGINECQAPNNHGTYFDLQVASIAAYINDDAQVVQTLIRAKDRIGVQFSPTGVQYDEMTRTQTAHYCCFNMQGWLNLAVLALRYGEDFVRYRVQKGVNKGATLGAAVEWLTSFCGSPWPFSQIDAFDEDRFVPLVIQASALGMKVELSESFQDRLYTVPLQKPIFHPHDGIRPFWSLESAFLECVANSRMAGHVAVSDQCAVS